MSIRSRLTIVLVAALPATALADQATRAVSPSALGHAIGDIGFDNRQDLNGDGVVNVLDVAARRLPDSTSARRRVLGSGTETITIEPLTVSAAASDMVTMTFLIQGNTVPLLGYSLDIEIVPQPGASGSVSANVGLTDFLDARNLVTAGGAVRHPLFSVIQDNGDGSVFINTLTEDNSTVLAADGLNDVLAEVVFDVSADAAGSFAIVLGAASALSDGAAQAVGYAFLEGSIHVISCAAAADCCDLDNNLIRDDNCLWCACADGCDEVPLSSFADMGGAFGACAPDGFSNIHDRNHALACFAGTDTCDAINIDAGGPFGSCTADGFCNIHDANHALSAFAGTTTCSCPSGPAPEFDPVVQGDAILELSAVRTRHRNADAIAVDVHIDALNAPLRSYQLGLTISGGRAGTLELIDIRIDGSKNALFSERSDAFSAANVVTGQMLSGLSADDGVKTPAAYLATFLYRPSPDAHGTFVIDVDTAGGSYLVAPGDGRIDIRPVEPLTVRAGR